MKLLHTGPVRDAKDAVSDFFKKIKESIVPDLLILRPAFAGAPGFQAPESGSQQPDLQEAKKHYMLFDTSAVPSRGTIPRRIMEWESIDILEPNENPRKDVITFEQAQKEVSKLLHAHGAAHEFMAYEAGKLCSAYPEAVKYTLHLMVGAQGEDFMFRPGEALKDIYASPPKREFKDEVELSEAVGEREPTSFIKGVFNTVAKIWKRIRGSPEADPINRPYMAHFYDPERKSGDKGLNVLNGDLKFQSALERMIQYWENASEHYMKGDKPRAFCALGHLIHLAQDLHVPAHVHNDIHGPSVFLGRLDSFEEWCKRANYPHITRPAGKENVQIWDSGPLNPPVPDASWNPQNIREKMAGFVNSFVVQTQRFRSVDAEGTDIDQMSRGKVSDAECFQQGSVLIPSAISVSAQLLANFLDYHQRIGK